MKRMISVLIVFAVLAIAYPAFGCTGFAVYGEHPIYGMNFDYPQTEIRLVAGNDGDISFFAMFLQTADGGFPPTVGMNGRGLFSSVQMQYPAETGQDSRGEDGVYVSELLDCILEYGTVDDVLLLLDEKRLVQWPDITLHTLLADAEGNALIAEAGEKRNEIIPMTDNFIVMTNFKNSYFRGQPYDRVTGVGADRYRAACQYIRENQESFGIDQGFEALSQTIQGGDYPTLCSMVFTPEEQSVYVALHRDFDRIWKISIPDSTIETYRGFEKDMKCYIPEDGVTASDLMDGDLAAYETYAGAEEADTGSADSPTLVWYRAAAILAAAALLAIGVLVRRRRKAS